MRAFHLSCRFLARVRWLESNHSESTSVFQPVGSAIADSRGTSFVRSRATAPHPVSYVIRQATDINEQCRYGARSLSCVAAFRLKFLGSTRYTRVLRCSIEAFTSRTPVK